MNILDRIMEERRVAVEEARRTMPVKELRRAAESRVHHSLPQALRSAPGPGIIAEMKKASPSAGELRPGYDPAAIARDYAAHGACALSVLTEPLHFLGNEEHLRSVRQAVDLPILRKDFICDPYQVYEAAAWGADVVLLIVAALDEPTLFELHRTARDRGLDVLAEAHTAEELETALRLEDAVVGVNSRNLKTLQTDLETARLLSRTIPSGRLAVAESGIRTRADIDRLRRTGYRGFLIGETLMRSPDPGGVLREFSRP